MDAGPARGQTGGAALHEVHLKATQYVSPLLHAHAGALAPCPGMALRFSRTDPGSPLATIHADHDLLEQLPNPLPTDMLGHFPTIFLDTGADYQVELLNASGRAVAAHRITAGRAVVAPDDAGLFADLAHLSPARGVASLRTEGWDKAGSGAADYVADALATPDLARQHPRFCVVTRNGRCFRLKPSGGLITVEQAGAKGDPGATGRIDDRPAFQAAVDYAATVGIERIGLAASTYSLWTPLRTSPAGQEAVDGHAIVLAPDQRLHFVGLARARTRLRFLAPGGASPAGTRAGEAFHIVGGKVWRGSGFYLPSKTKVDWHRIDRTTTRQSLTLEHLVIDGGTRKSGFYGWPARPSDGAGWDITHKGIRCQADVRGADITILDCEMTGWRGETLYSSGDPSAKLTVRNSSFTHSNGQGLNPNGCMVDVEGAHISDCFSGIEGWTGLGGGRMVDVEIVDCYGIQGKSGGAFGLDGEYFDRRRVQASAPGPGLPDRQGAPGTLAALPVKPGRIDIVVRSCGRGYLGSWLTGRIKAVDTTLVIGDGTAMPGGSRGLDLDIEMVTDRTELAYLIIACRMTGVATDDIKVRLNATATPAAVAVDRRTDRAITWHGLIGSDVLVEFSGRDGRQPPRADAPATGAPRITRR